MNIIVFVLIGLAVAFVGLTVLSFVTHLLFSPWLLLAVIAGLAWVKFRPRRSRR